MKWLYSLERRFGRFCIPNLMAYICVTSLAVYIMTYLVGMDFVSLISLSRSLVMEGQVWRLLTFIFVPPVTSPIWVLFSLYFYYIIGSGLEDAWGSFAFNVYYLCGVIGSIIAAMITGWGSITYLNLSLFLAYAALYPNNEVLLFFILPIKIKYLAYLDWALFALSLIGGTWSTRAAILASLVNYAIFFGPGIIKRMRDNKRYSAQRRQFRRAMSENNRKNNNWR